MRAIVLSGGGSRGAYQLGVWRALRKLHIKYDIVTGTSIGSLNGALMTQNSYFTAYKVWHSVNYDTIIDKPVEKPIVKTYVKGFIQDGGIDTKRLQKLVTKYIKEEKVKKSKINYGLVTYNLSKLKALELPKNKIPNGKLCDYIVASASCFPALKPKNLDSDIYIDGGFYDNMPINLALSMGATEIIAVDLEAIGVKKKPIDDSVPITYISPNNDIIPFLDFDNKMIKRTIKFGYNDTMKVFNRLDGVKFTFKKGHLRKNYDKYYNCLKNRFDVIFDSSLLINKISKTIVYKKITNSENSYAFMNELIESLGLLFKLDETKIYDINNYNNVLVSYINNLDNLDKSLIEDKIKNNKMKSLMNTKWIVKYIYESIKKENDNKIISNLSILFPKEFLGALYLALL